MRLGALLTPAGENPHHLVNEAKAIEAEGFDSVWTAHAMGRGFMMHDPLVALAAAAAVTSRVELGTAILQLPIYHPTDVALKVATLMQIAGDRVRLGVGAGSTKSDYLVHEADFGQRFRDFDQKLAQLRQCFAHGTANTGHLALPQRALHGPPLLLGTWGHHVSRAASEFDGWIASGMHRTVEECSEALKAYRSAGGGRAIVSTILVTKDTDLGGLREKLEAFRDADFDDAVVMINPGAPPLSAVRQLI